MLAEVWPTKATAGLSEKSDGPKSTFLPICKCPHFSGSPSGSGRPPAHVQGWSEPSSHYAEPHSSTLKTLGKCHIKANCIINIITSRSLPWIALSNQSRISYVEKHQRQIQGHLLDLTTAALGFSWYSLSCLLQVPTTSSKGRGKPGVRGLPS